VCARARVRERERGGEGEECRGKDKNFGSDKILG